MCRRRITSLDWYRRNFTGKRSNAITDEQMDALAEEVWKRIRERELDHEPSSGPLRSSWQMIDQTL